VFFVFMNLALQIRKNVNPESMAAVAMHTTRDAVKAGRPAVEKAFKANMPMFLRNLRQALLNDLIPLLRKRIEGELSKVITKSFDQSGQVFNVAVKNAVARIKASGGKDAKMDAALLAQLIVDEFDKEKEKLYSDPAQTMGRDFLESRKMLEGLNRRLDLFTSNQPKTREEALELRFIRAWTSLLHRGDTEDTARPGLEPPSAAPVNAPAPPPAK
jgi:hypothetical protein